MTGFCLPVFPADKQSAGDIILTGGRAGVVTLVSPSFESTEDFPKMHNCEIHSLALSPDGKLAVSGDNSGELVAWDVAARKGVKLSPAHHGDVRRVVFSKSGRYFATASKDREIKVWDSATLKLLTTLKGHKSYVYDLDFSPDEKYIASVGSDYLLIVWDTQSGKKLREKANAHYEAIFQVRFSPDGKTIYTASSDAFIKLWDFDSLNNKAVYKGNKMEIQAIAVSPDGKIIVSGGRDRSILAFSTETGKLLSTVDYPNNFLLTGLTYISNGNSLVASDATGEIMNLDIKTWTFSKVKALKPILALAVR